jgi:hypothetical protein
LHHFCQTFKHFIKFLFIKHYVFTQFSWTLFCLNLLKMKHCRWTLDFPSYNCLRFMCLLGFYAHESGLVKLMNLQGLYLWNLCTHILLCNVQTQCKVFHCSIENHALFTIVWKYCFLFVVLLSIIDSLLLFFVAWWILDWDVIGFVMLNEESPITFLC